MSTAVPQVTKYIQQMQDLRALASSDSVDSFVLSYSNILNVNSAITPNLVEKLCACRCVCVWGGGGAATRQHQGQGQGQHSICHALSSHEVPA